MENRGLREGAENFFNAHPGTKKAKCRGKQAEDMGIHDQRGAHKTMRGKREGGEVNN
jgi:hypothetical protein